MPNRITVGPQPDAYRIRYGCLMGRGLAMQAPSFFQVRVFQPKSYFLRSGNSGIWIAVEHPCQIFDGKHESFGKMNIKTIPPQTSLIIGDVKSRFIQNEHFIRLKNH